MNVDKIEHDKEEIPTTSNAVETPQCCLNDVCESGSEINKPGPSQSRSPESSCHDSCCGRDLSSIPDSSNAEGEHAIVPNSLVIGSCCGEEQECKCDGELSIQRDLPILRPSLTKGNRGMHRAGSQAEL